MGLDKLIKELEIDEDLAWKFWKDRGIPGEQQYEQSLDRCTIFDWIYLFTSDLQLKDRLGISDNGWNTLHTLIPNTPTLYAIKTGRKASNESLKHSFGISISPHSVEPLAMVSITHLFDYLKSRNLINRNSIVRYTFDAFKVNCVIGIDSSE